MRTRIRQALKYLMGKYGNTEKDGTKFLRIDEDDLFEGDGGVSLDTAVDEIEWEINRKKYEKE